MAQLLADRGVPVIDADRLSREAVSPGSPALAEIAAVWPDVIGADGVLDRRALASRVFADPAARRRLEGILHPRIAELAERHAGTLAAAGHRVAVYEASLLVETGRHRELDGLILVTAPEDLRIRRVAARDGVSEMEVYARIAAQLSDDEKRQEATHVIVNDGDRAALADKVAALIPVLKQQPTAPAPTNAAD